MITLKKPASLSTFSGSFVAPQMGWDRCDVCKNDPCTCWDLRPVSETVNGDCGCGFDDCYVCSKTISMIHRLNKIIHAVNPGSCDDPGGCGNALCWNCYPDASIK